MTPVAIGTSKGTICISFSVAETRNTLFQFFRMIAGNIKAALSSRYHCFFISSSGCAGKRIILHPCTQEKMISRCTSPVKPAGMCFPSI